MPEQRQRGANGRKGCGITIGQPDDQKLSVSQDLSAFDPRFALCTLVTGNEVLNWGSLKCSSDKVRGYQGSEGSPTAKRDTKDRDMDNATKVTSDTPELKSGEEGSMYFDRQVRHKPPQGVITGLHEFLSLSRGHAGSHSKCQILDCELRIRAIS